MKNSTQPLANLKTNLEPDRNQISVNPDTAEENRVRLRWLGPDPQKPNADDPEKDPLDHSRSKISSQQLAERFVKNCADILCTVDRDGRFMNVSIASKLILGYDPEEMEGKLMSDFLIRDDVDRSLKVIRGLVSGQGFTGLENRYISKNNTVINMSWSIRWSAEDQLIYCVGRDDREKKAVEKELQRLNESLELKIKERTIQLEQSMKELEAFSYSVSHDLRAPLRIINGYSRLLTSHKNENQDSESREFLDAIIESTKYMGKLIDDLLNLSRLDKEAVHKQVVNMDFLARLTVKGLQNEDESVTPNIVVHNLNAAFCDQSLIKQVWINLISNAIKYSKKKSDPRIEVGSYEKDSTIVYYIKDNGAGFDMKFAAKLFGVFVRLHNRNEFEGTGVGLALAHRIITKHGGKVWANGKVDEGATFYFSLPKQ